MKSKETKKDILIRKCNHIVNFLSKIESKTSMRLNGIGWMIQDENDPNYVLLKAHHDCEFLRHRISWLMNNIKDDIESGSISHKHLYKVLRSLRQYTQSTIGEYVGLRNSLNAVHKNFKVISDGEWDLFQEWMYKNITLMENCIANKHQKYWDVSDVFIQATEHLTHMIDWSIKSCPKAFPDTYPIYTLFAYRYRNHKHKDELMEVLNGVINCKNSVIAERMLRAEKKFL